MIFLLGALVLVGLAAERALGPRGHAPSAAGGPLAPSKADVVEAQGEAARAAARARSLYERWQGRT
jgi:hypothetical protein